MVGEEEEGTVGGGVGVGVGVGLKCGKGKVRGWQEIWVGIHRGMPVPPRTPSVFCMRSWIMLAVVAPNALHDISHSRYRTITPFSSRD